MKHHLKLENLHQKSNKNVKWENNRKPDKDDEKSYVGKRHLQCY